jgi:hypothetical protein
MKPSTEKSGISNTRPLLNFKAEKCLSIATSVMELNRSWADSCWSLLSGLVHCFLKREKAPKRIWVDHGLDKLE